MCGQIVLISQGELKENPDAVIQAVKFFMFSTNHQQPAQMFKAITTDDMIEKESLEIENIMGSQGSFLSFSSSLLFSNLKIGSVQLNFIYL